MPMKLKVKGGRACKIEEIFIFYAYESLRRAGMQKLKNPDFSCQGTAREPPRSRMTAKTGPDAPGSRPEAGSPMNSYSVK